MFDTDRLSRIDAWMGRYVDQGKFPGCSMVLSHRGDIVHRACVGAKSVEDATPYQDDTVVRVFSMTKPVTSVMLMTLVERGLFHLDAPLSAFLPEFADMQALIPGATALGQTAPAPSPTLHQCLTHTSGLSYSFNAGLLGQVYKDGGLDYGPTAPGTEAVTKALAAVPLAFQPGARWEYSVGIDVIGRVIEVVTGKPLDVAFRDMIGDPLGMTDTDFTLRDDQIGRTASLYTPPGGDAMQLGRTATGGLKLVEDAAGSAYRATTTFSGGGGLVSTLDDYLAFAEMLRNGGAWRGERILSPRTLDFMMRNHLPGEIASMGPTSFAEMPMQGTGFGIGGAVILDPARCRMMSSVGDFSWGGMASTYFWVDRAADIAVVFFTQLMPSSAYPNRTELKALVHGAMTGG